MAGSSGAITASWHQTRAGRWAGTGWVTESPSSTRVSSQTKRYLYSPPVILDLVMKLRAYGRDGPMGEVYSCLLTIMHFMEFIFFSRRNKKIK